MRIKKGIFWIVLILLLVVLFSFFVAKRFGISNITRIGIDEESNFQITQRLDGQIIRGDKINDLPKECSSQYFLVDGDKKTWIVPGYEDRRFFPEIFASHENEIVQIIGDKDVGYSPCKYGVSANCGCDLYLIVKDIETVKVINNDNLERKISD